MSRSNSGRSPQRARPELQNLQAPQSSLQMVTTDRSMQLGSSGNLDDGIAAAAEAGASENTGKRMVRVNSTLNRKVEFHKTKKLRKKASALYMHAMAEVGAGKFQAWSRAELVELITHTHRVELRNEERLETVALRDLCESMYAGKPSPPKPPGPTFQRIVFENVMARRIQNCWIIFQATKRYNMEEDQGRRYQQQVQDLSGQATGEIGQAELMYMTMPNEEVVNGTTIGDLDASIDLAGQETDMTSPRSGIKRKKGVNVLDLPWTAPDLDKAKRYSDYVQPRKDVKNGVKFKFRTTTTGRHCCLGGMGEQFDLWEEGQVSEFSTYGPGVTNYFKFMKWCFWLFVTLTVIALPEIVLNTTGSYEGNSGLKAIAKTTIGNLASSTANTSIHIAVPGCDNYGIYQISCELNADSLALFYAIIDIIVSATIFIAFVWLYIFERLEEKTLDESTIRASMYTIAVSGLPPDVTEEELYEHFGGLIKSKNSPIVGISLAYDNTVEIKTCKKRGELIRSKVRMVHEHRHKCTELRKKGLDEEVLTKTIEEERNKFYEKMKKTNTELKAIEEELARLSELAMNVVYAYITFDKSSDRNKILEIYQRVSLYTYLCSNAHLRIKGKYIRVRPAPEPSVIIWENLSYTLSRRNRRKIVTTFGALLLIVITLILVFSSKYLNSTSANNGSSASSSLCPGGWDSWDEATQQTYVEDNPSDLHCYCDEESTIQQAADPLCRDYLRKNIQSQVLVYFASMIVLMVNFLIDKAINYSSAFEKHHTSDGKGMSVFNRVFILKYINTAAVFFINNNNVVLRVVFGVHGASSAEFSSDWFNEIGTTIILVQMGDIVNAHAHHFYQFIKLWRTKHTAKQHPENYLTQDELNKALAGPKFEFAGNYAQLMSTFFVCLTFSSGIPILYPIAAVNFICFYLVEKYQFVHLYKIPPHFNTLVGQRATSLVPFAILIHLIMSIWVLSNNSLFSTNVDENSSVVSSSVFGDTIANKITAKATFPLFVTFCVLIFLRVAMTILRMFWSSLAKFYFLVFGFITPKRAAAAAKKKPKKKSAAKDVVAYTRAVQRNLIKGLSNYNILLNPVYKEAFGITWKFAAENKNVRDVKNIKAKAHAGAEEDDAAKADQLARAAGLQGALRKPKKPMAKNRSFFGSIQQGDGAVDRPDSNRLSRPPSAKLDAPVNPPEETAAIRGSARMAAIAPGIDLRIDTSRNSNPSSRPPTPGTGSGSRTPVTPPVVAAAAVVATPSAGGATPTAIAYAEPVSASASASGRAVTPASSGRERDGSSGRPMSNTPNASARSHPASPAAVHGSHPPSPAGSGRNSYPPQGQGQGQYPPGYPQQPPPGYYPQQGGPPPQQRYSQQAPPPMPQQYNGPAPGRGQSPYNSPPTTPHGMTPQQYMQYQQMQYIQQQQQAYNQAQARSPAGRPTSPQYYQGPQGTQGQQQQPRGGQYYPPGQDPRGGGGGSGRRY